MRPRRNRARQAAVPSRKPQFEIFPANEIGLDVRPTDIGT